MAEVQKAIKLMTVEWYLDITYITILPIKNGGFFLKYGLAYSYRITVLFHSSLLRIKISSLSLLLRINVVTMDTVENQRVISESCV